MMLLRRGEDGAEFLAKYANFNKKDTFMDKIEKKEGANGIHNS